MLLLISVSITHYATAQLRDPSFRIWYNTDDFMIVILDQKGTISYIHSNLDNNTFNFTVNDAWPIDRTRALYHSTGDITLRIRPANSTDAYTTFSTTDAHEGPARLVEVADSLIANDVTSLLHPGHGLNIQRIYRQVNDSNGGFIIQIKDGGP
jgi:hypothetical protein